jgi:hypothetical protein
MKLQPQNKYFNMKHYILTSPNFKGQISYKFSDDGYLTYFYYEATMNEKQRDWLLTKMPLTIRGFEDMVSSSAVVKIQEVKIGLEFEDFWNTYPHKRNKHRCEPLWDKMNDKHRLQCLLSLEPYKRYLERTRIRHKDPEGYLRGKEFLNDWNKLN